LDFGNQRKPVPLLKTTEGPYSNWTYNIN